MLNLIDVWLPSRQSADDPAQIDVLIENDISGPALIPATIDDAAQEIGRLVAQLIRDGDCLQTGIGAIPAAILNQLTDKMICMHGGLIDDGGMRLIQQGTLNGARKAIDTAGILRVWHWEVTI